MLATSHKHKQIHVVPGSKHSVSIYPGTMVLADTVICLNLSSPSCIELVIISHNFKQLVAGLLAVARVEEVL